MRKRKNKRVGRIKRDAKRSEIEKGSREERGGQKTGKKKKVNDKTENVTKKMVDDEDKD